MLMLRDLFNKIFGFYQRPFNEEWDKQLNEMLNHDDNVVETTELTITFRVGENNITVWTGNKYYSFGYLWRVNDKMVCTIFQYRPRITTMKKLSDRFTAVRSKDRKREYEAMFKK